MGIFLGRPDLMLLFLAQVLLIVIQIVLLQRVSGELKEKTPSHSPQKIKRSRAR